MLAETKNRAKKEEELQIYQAAANVTQRAVTGKTINHHLHAPAPPLNTAQAQRTAAKWEVTGISREVLSQSVLSSFGDARPNKAKVSLLGLTPALKKQQQLQ